MINRLQANTLKTLKEIGRNPRVHPNGFIQIDIGGFVPNQRVHIWPKQHINLGQDSDSPIHDHIFDMESKVLQGSLTQLRYNFELSHKGLPTHEIYMADYLKKSESVLKPTGVLGNLSLDANFTEAIVENEFYYQPAFTFHDTQPGRTPLVTLMTKTWTYEYSPRVLVPVGNEPDNNFRRDQYSQSDLWEIIEDAIVK